jgi:hypothetical protein
MKHKCKAPECDQQISERFLMCSRHWSIVPRSIQLQVHKAWRALNQGKKPEQIGTYRAAVKQAIAAVSRKPSTN